MNVRDLAVKFHAYAHYVTARDWARETLSLPSLFSIVPDIAQERRMQRVAQGKLAHIPGLVLWTTTEVLFHEQGPLATIWLRGIPQPSQASQTEGAHRQGLFDAILGKYCM
jgi:hypothetical protein